MPDPTPADRAFRALADAVGDSRPRRPGDGTDPGIPVAATVVFVRDSAAGPEVLMLERPDRGSFAGAWVFPGGKLDDADRIGAAAADAHADELAAAHRAACRETWEETGLVVDAATLVPVSCWDPPPGLPLRIRTWFFLAPDPGGELVLSPEEVTAAAWVRPGDMLARHGRGEVTLYPPTWVTLHEMAAQPDADAMLGEARLSGIRLYESVARRGGDGPLLLWQGDAAYDDEHATGPQQHRLELGALPWIYRRTG